MKHNTHIYLAAKAIELMTQSVDTYCAQDWTPAPLQGSAKTKERNAAKERQRLFRYHEEKVTEASWAPDDVLRDNHPYHVFKLMAVDEFKTIPDSAKKYPFTAADGQVFYRYGGGLPYRIDHLANEIIDMEKLRAYNDQYQLRQIIYKYLMISHYLVDAHVPVHCDLRDDPPESAEEALKKPEAQYGYLKKTAHGDLEEAWNKAVTPIALQEEIAQPEYVEDLNGTTTLSPHIMLCLDDCAHGRVKVPVIEDHGLMNFAVSICLRSKQRSRALFPLQTPGQRNDAILPQMTEDIFKDCVGNLLAVWRYIWGMSRG